MGFLLNFHKREKLLQVFKQFMDSVGQVPSLLLKNQSLALLCNFTMFQTSHFINTRTICQCQISDLAHIPLHIILSLWRGQMWCIHTVSPEFSRTASVSVKDNQCMSFVLVFGGFFFFLNNLYSSAVLRKQCNDPVISTCTFSSCVFFKPQFHSPIYIITFKLPFLSCASLHMSICVYKSLWPLYRVIWFMWP